MRLIDADALKRNFEENVPAFAQDMVPGMHYIIDRAKTIDAVPQWIPVEEASPERENESIMRHYYLTTNAYGAVSITAYEFDGRTWGVHGWNSDIRIVAWMPLPKPYERKES